jgi:hypothetical protein
MMIEAKKNKAKYANLPFIGVTATTTNDTKADAR